MRHEWVQKAYIFLLSILSYVPVFGIDRRSRRLRTRAWDSFDRYKTFDRDVIRARLEPDDSDDTQELDVEDDATAWRARWDTDEESDYI